MTNLCPHHALVHAGLRAALGRRHHGHRVARRALDQIARSCPECRQIAQEGPSEPRVRETGPWARPSLVAAPSRPLNAGIFHGYSDEATYEPAFDVEHVAIRRMCNPEPVDVRTITHTRYEGREPA